MQLRQALSKCTQGAFKLTGKSEKTQCIETDDKHIVFNVNTMDAALLVHGNKLLKAGIVDLLDRIYESQYWGTCGYPSGKEISDMLALAKDVDVPEDIDD